MRLVNVIFIVICLNCSSAIAEIPHTFQAGQTAKASEVNENFQYVNRTNYVLKSNGQLVGDVVSMGWDSVTIINTKGFLLNVTSTGGAYGVYSDYNTYYASPDCTGPSYVKTPFVNTILGSSLFWIGYVLAKSDISNPSYVSSYVGNRCYKDIPEFVGNLSKIMPNDPALTGVDVSPNASPVTPPSNPLVYQQPITLEVR